MNLIQQVTSQLATLNRKLVTHILAVGMPRYGKKLVFVVSLFVSLKRNKVGSSADLCMLNDELRLASCVEALEFPAMFSSKVWESCDINSKACKPTLEEGSKAVVDIMPKWLQYDSIEHMVADAKQVLHLVHPALA